MRSSTVAVLLLGCSFPGGLLAQQINVGHFEGTVQAEWVRSGGQDRNMKLLKDFTYVDPKGKKWTAKKGFETDGASIPKVFWSIVGGPFEGGYREAAVIHDWYCDTKTEPWKDVHRIFYYASMAAGVSEKKAKILYAGVRIGGPKWGDNSSKCYPSCHGQESMSPDKHGKLTVQPDLSEKDAHDIADWVTANQPSLEEIDKYAREKFPNSTFGHDAAQ